MGAFSSILFSGAFLHGSFSGVFSLFSSLLFSLFWISEDGMSERAPLFAFLFCFFLSPLSKLEMRGVIPSPHLFLFSFSFYLFFQFSFQTLGTSNGKVRCQLQFLEKGLRLVWLKNALLVYQLWLVYVSVKLTDFSRTWPDLFLACSFLLASLFVVSMMFDVADIWMAYFFVNMNFG